MTFLATTRRSLGAGWRVRDIPTAEASPTTSLPWLPAEVPGHVHLDLLRAGVIPDPYYRLHERDVAWVDEADWVYETTFHVEAPAPPHAFLLFHGLDTVAEIALNGEPLGSTDNMFIPHEFRVDGRLRAGAGEAGDNVLRVTFLSALRIGRERHQEWDKNGNTFVPPDWFKWGPRSFLRKAQYMYGWDWGPELVSCGLWRPVELVAVPAARLRDWKYEVAFQGEQAAVTIEAFIERAPGAEEIPLTLSAALTGSGSRTESYDDPLPAPVSATAPTGTGRRSVSVTLTIDRARRWWPNGSAGPDGPAHPALYTLALSLTSAGSPVDSLSAKIGLRTVELVREPDADGKGEGFKFRINGQDIFMKGANWIPAESFPAQVHDEPLSLHTHPERVRDMVRNLLRAASDAGFNMLRVWGGGLYESEHFYTLCDEHGILVWQDFPYACAQYPDTAEWCEAARVEAVAAVRRLRVHPSLALWCGNNENNWFYDNRGSGESDPPPFLGRPLYHEVLPAVVAAEDSRRPYWPSSPYGGDDPNSQDTGDCHNWDVWHGRGDWTHFAENKARFVSEFGFASSCGLAAWNGCLAEQDKSPLSPAVRWHDKTRKGYETYLGYIALHFPVPQTLEDLVYYSQLNQAEALKFGIEHYRRLKGRCWGTLFWQINDCWPTQSWAILDSAGEGKAAYYAARKFYAPLLLSLVRQGDAAEAHLTSDWLAPVAGTLSLTVESFDGEVLARELFAVEAPANATAAVARLELAGTAGRERDVFVYGRFEPAGGAPAAENLLFLAEPRDLRLADPGLAVQVEEDGAQAIAVTVSARRFAAYVWLRINGQALDPARPQDNFFHLRAGESRRLLLDRAGALRTAEEARGRLVVRSL